MDIGIVKLFNYDVSEQSMITFCMSYFNVSSIKSAKHYSDFVYNN